MVFFLLPNVFNDEQSTNLLLPQGLSDLVATLDILIAESERTGRRYLMKILEKSPLARQMPIFLLNEHSKKSAIAELVELITSGKNVGLISDAGLPGISDPGSALVSDLRKQGFSQITAVPGPSSITLALLLSGLPATPFSFHGYLPQERESRQKALRGIEKTAGTHIFIETPYRNLAFFDDCVEILLPTAKLCIAANLTFDTQWVRVHSIQKWKTMAKPDIYKIPVVFLINTGH